MTAVQLLAAALIVLALALLASGLLLRRRAGLPWARIVASDVGVGRPLERPLVAPRYGLSGKPDYLIERGGVLIPVEVKPGRHAPRPYDSDLMQLAAYCLLVEESTGRAPPYGLLRYAGASFRLAYTPAVRQRLVALLDEMHALLEASDVARSHDEPRRCAGCGLRTRCTDSLTG